MVVATALGLQILLSLLNLFGRFGKCVVLVLLVVAAGGAYGVYEFGIAPYLLQEALSAGP